MAKMYKRTQFEPNYNIFPGYFEKNHKKYTFFMFHPVYFLPTLYTKFTMSIFGIVIVLAFYKCILLGGFKAKVSRQGQLYANWHRFPIVLLYGRGSNLETIWRPWSKSRERQCRYSLYIQVLYATCAILIGSQSFIYKFRHLLLILKDAIFPHFAEVDFGNILVCQDGQLRELFNENKIHVATNTDLY